MNDRNCNQNNWDDSVYGTGNTKPPKSRGGLFALMLILIIFLCGILAVLGILNIKLFHQLRQKQEVEYPITFTQNETVPTETCLPELIGAQERSGEASIHLQQAPKGIENVPTEGGLSLQEIYTQNIDSVVSITALRSSGGATGTGVVLTEDGFIVTNAHVVENATSIRVCLTDNRELDAALVGMDEVSDLAVLCIDAQDLTAAQFGSSESLRVGDTVVAIGDPLGVEFRGTYTNGIVSAINRDVSVDGRSMTLIQTNAALNAGNSGGPLINCYGQVIGINTMKIGAFTDAAGVEGLGFAIPSTTVKEIVDQLIAQGYVSGRPTLGVEGDTLSLFYQHYYRLPAGLIITEVDRSSDAYAKGVRDGDILMSVGESRITSADQLQQEILNHQVGDTVQVLIYRDGQQYQLDLTLAENRG
ncbi:MAG: trypsin-like peptidase domain-containing protein [Eubacteriales bacterium]|nr:trypsin-like peptidase domain-containing protein [Eubacteriales bacterium]